MKLGSTHTQGLEKHGCLEHLEAGRNESYIHLNKIKLVEGPG